MKTCGLDVHKDTIFCAIYDGKDSVVEKFSTFTPDIEAMVQEPVARVELIVWSPACPEPADTGRRRPTGKQSEGSNSDFWMAIVSKNFSSNSFAKI